MKGKLLMKYGLTGSRRKLTEDAEREIEDEIESLLSRGHRISMAVARGFGAKALAQLLQNNSDDVHNVQVVLPTDLDTYADYYLDQASDYDISDEDANKFVGNLRQLQKINPDAVKELSYKTCTDDAFNACNQAVVDETETVIAYHIDGSPLVEKAITYARDHDKKVIVKTYQTLKFAA